MDVKKWIKGSGTDQFTYCAYGGETDTTIYEYEDFPPIEPIGSDVLVIVGEDKVACPGELIMIVDENGIVHADPYLMINGQLEAVDIAIDDLIALIQSYMK